MAAARADPGMRGAFSPPRRCLLPVWVRTAIAITAGDDRRRLSRARSGKDDQRRAHE